MRVGFNPVVWMKIKCGVDVARAIFYLAHLVSNLDFAKAGGSSELDRINLQFSVS